MKKEYQRDDAELFVKAMERDVKTDVTVEIVSRNGKLKAWCPDVQAFLQFPTALRTSGAKFTADVTCSEDHDGKGPTGTIFYRVVRKSIRRHGTNEVVG